MDRGKVKQAVAESTITLPDLSGENPEGGDGRGWEDDEVEEGAPQPVRGHSFYSLPEQLSHMEELQETLHTHRFKTLDNVHTSISCQF
ncbi:hypothetical protein JOB18_028529 [Solea senegalensis]|uniref:Uncharacterized protein n=1 Tax=Solea senegalensis TaxID=28829 RepID=A0AAV6RZV2_SOLSE|nr:hypothetical protein JOB18_028529 [Solea senegalensis]